MKKFILFIFSTLFISNICSAEIIREINSFDNSTMLTSVINTKDYVEDIPREKLVLIPMNLNILFLLLINIQ